MPVVVLRRLGEIAEIVLRRPEKLNAMNMAWVTDLLDVVTAVVDDKPELVVIRGEGRAFCAGLDLDMLELEATAQAVAVDLGDDQPVQVLQRDKGILLPRIKCRWHAVRGACDIRIVSEDAVLGLPGALEGLPPGMAPWRLPRHIGLGRTLRLAISGERIGAHEALHMGLVDHVLPAVDFAEQASAMVERYLRVPQAAARATKELARSSFDTDFATAYARSREPVQQCLDASDVAQARTGWSRRRD